MSPHGLALERRLLLYHMSVLRLINLRAIDSRPFSGTAIRQLIVELIVLSEFWSARNLALWIQNLLLLLCHGTIYLIWPNNSCRSSALESTLLIRIGIHHLACGVNNRSCVGGGGCCGTVRISNIRIEAEAIHALLLRLYAKLILATREVLLLGRTCRKLLHSAALTIKCHLLLLVSS